MMLQEIGHATFTVFLILSILACEHNIWSNGPVKNFTSKLNLKGLTSGFASALISFPPAKDVFMVSRFSDLFALTREPYIQNRTILAIVTNDLALDSYLTLYMALIVDLFDDREDEHTVADMTAKRIQRFRHYSEYISERYSIDQSANEHKIDNNDIDLSQHIPIHTDSIRLNTSFILFTPNTSELSLAEATGMMLGILPETSILITIQHGKQMFSFASLSKLDSKYNLKAPGIVYHMNHERPWLHSKKHYDYIANNINETIQQYQQFPLVLRNYYYELLLNVSLYIPVFAPFYGHILNNYNNNIFLSSLQLSSSKRFIKCWFRGRISYEYDGLYKIDPINGEKLYANTSTAEIERKLLRSMKEEKGLLKDCIVEERPFSGPRAGYDVETEYEQYIKELSQAAFSFCPAGNNPETFRLHESLDVGTIPIMVRHPVPERDFLRHPFWIDYPGPVLNDWTEVEDYLNNITDEQMDRLQLKLAKWYIVFKDRVRNHSRKRLYDTLLSFTRTPVEVIKYAIIDLEMKARRKDINIWDYYNYHYGMDQDMNIVEFEPTHPHDSGSSAIIVEEHDKKTAYLPQGGEVVVSPKGEGSVDDMNSVSQRKPALQKPLDKRLDNLDSNVATIVTTINDIYGKIGTLDNAIMTVDQKVQIVKNEDDMKVMKLEEKVATLTQENSQLNRRVESLEQEVKDMVKALEMLAKLLR